MRCNDISAENAKGQVRTAQQCSSVVHLLYSHNVLPDAQDTDGQVPALPKSCLHPMMIPFRHFPMKHMSYLDGLVHTALIAFLARRKPVAAL